MKARSFGNAITIVSQLPSGHMRVTKGNRRPPSPDFLHQASHIWNLLEVGMFGHAVSNNLLCSAVRSCLVKIHVMTA
jgi:hypothetical protein